MICMTSVTAVDVSYKKIHLTNSDRIALVDERDYQRLNYFRWYVSFANGSPVAYRTALGKSILMHREILGYHSSDDFNHVSHRNKNKLDNRYDNLVAKYSTPSRKTRFHASNKLRDKLNSIAPVLAIARNGLVLHSNLTGVIETLHQEIDGLLSQRLKAVQLLIESKNELLASKEQIINALSQIESAIASYEQTIDSMQPRIQKIPSLR